MKIPKSFEKLCKRVLNDGKPRTEIELMWTVTKAYLKQKKNKVL